MPYSLNRSLNGVSKGAPGPDASKGTGGRGHSGKQGSRPKSPARPRGGGGAQKGDARGRSASAGKGKGNNRIRRSVMPTRREHVVWGKDGGFAHTRERGRSPSPKHGGKGPKGLCFPRRWELQVRKGLQRQTRHSQPISRREGQQEGEWWVGGKKPPAASAAADPERGRVV